MSDSRPVWPDFKMPVVTQEEAHDNPNPGAQRLVVPGKEEQEYWEQRIHNPHRCGHCKFFNWEGGQRELKRQEVFERIFNELEHDPAWYGRVDLAGLCEQFEGHMTFKVSPPVIPRHLIDSDVDTTFESYGEILAHPDKDQRVDCPYYTPGKGVAATRQYVGKRVNAEEFD